jgi:tetratricopeptide (TPR) repeat protein
MAQDATLAEFYGQGVHAFNAGDYVKADEFLTKAIDNGSTDPRAFYFRGLVNSLTGRDDEAHADWRRAAELELDGEYDLLVGKSLQRIQGPVRICIEDMRRQVRLENRARVDARNRARYEQLQQAEQDVLRDMPATQAPPAAIPPSENPFERDGGVRQGEPRVLETPENPVVDPFGTTQPQPAAPDTPSNPDPADVTDPFATPEDDPFGGGNR